MVAERLSLAEELLRASGNFVRPSEVLALFPELLERLVVETALGAERADLVLFKLSVLPS